MPKLLPGMGDTFYGQKLPGLQYVLLFHTPSCDIQCTRAVTDFFLLLKQSVWACRDVMSLTTAAYSSAP